MRMPVGTIVTWPYRNALQTGEVISCTDDRAFVRPSASRSGKLVPKPLDALVVVLMPAQLAQQALAAVRALVAADAGPVLPMGPVGPSASLLAPSDTLTPDRGPQAEGEASSVAALPEAS